MAGGALVMLVRVCPGTVLRGIERVACRVLYDTARANSLRQIYISISMIYYSGPRLYTNYLRSVAAIAVPDVRDLWLRANTILLHFLLPLLLLLLLPLPPVLRFVLKKTKCAKNSGLTVDKLEFISDMDG